MNSYDLLTKQVDDGSINLVNIVAVPRSVSTALGRAMNESELHSIFVNEPFNRNNRSLELASRHILDQAANGNVNNDRPLTVITKNMATYLGTPEFTDLEGISMCTLWSVRDPRIQIGSLVTRMANDIAVENGADVIEQDEVSPYLEEVTNTLADSKISSGFSRTGWSSIGSHFVQKNPEAKHAVIDGGELMVDPVRVLFSACKHVNFPYSPAMISGWSSGYVNLNTGTSRFNTEENAWTNQAANSAGIVPVARPPIDLSILPQALYDHLENVAIPTYEAMIAE